MNLHEYQAKELMSRFGITVQRGKLAHTVEEAVENMKQLQAETGTKFVIVKAQVHAGGRGKGGGVKLAKNLDELREKSGAILGMTLVTKQTGSEGKLVRKVLIAEDMYYPGPEETKEYYLSILLDRATSQHVIVYSTEGGMDIEEVAEHTPHLVFREWISPVTGLMPFEARKIAYNLGFSGKAVKEVVSFVTKLYKAFIETDAEMIEINPMLKTSDARIVAVDGKMSIDGSALFRQPELVAMRDLDEENPVEVEASEHRLNFVKLDGNVGCMVNGAGLAMATMDIIKLAGGAPANFLDVGGTASAETVEAGFRIILRDPNVKAILVNIFGGIVRCDRVANGIVEAYEKMGDAIQIPIIVRLQGTNAELAKQIIDNSGLKVYSAILLREAADKVQEVLAQA